MSEEEEVIIILGREVAGIDPASYVAELNERVNAGTVRVKLVPLRRRSDLRTIDEE